MSLHEYKVGQKISAQDHSFYALIMAAFHKADTYNLQKLRCAFFATWLELTARDTAPGGLLEGEQFSESQEYPKVPDAGRYLYGTWVEEEEDEEELDGA